VIPARAPCKFFVDFSGWDCCARERDFPTERMLSRTPSIIRTVDQKRDRSEVECLPKMPSRVRIDPRDRGGVRLYLVFYLYSSIHSNHKQHTTVSDSPILISLISKRLASHSSLSPLAFSLCLISMLISFRFGCQVVTTGGTICLLLAP
jgi:hypothetical protein